MLYYNETPKMLEQTGDGIQEDIIDTIINVVKEKVSPQKIVDKIYENAIDFKPKKPDRSDADADANRSNRSDANRSSSDTLIMKKQKEKLLKSFIGKGYNKKTKTKTKKLINLI